MDLSQEDLIPLFVKGQDLLTQDILTGDRVTKTRHFRPSNLHAWKLRAIRRGKGHSREAANMMSRCLRESSPQVYESHWWRFVAFCRSKRWHVFRVRSHHFSSYMMHLFRHGLLPPTIISHRTSECGFCATSLGVWSSSRLAHQATHQSFPVGMSGATQNHAQVGPSSCVVIIAETAIRIRRWCWRGILGWRHSRKLADHKMCVPVSIGFGKTALIPARFECRARQMCVRQRKHTATTCSISVAGTWFPSEESATELGPWMDHRARDCPLESDGSGENAVSCQTIETLHMGFWKNRGGGGGGGGGGMSADVYTLESQHQRYYEEPHKPMDRGDCQGSLHSSWLRIWPSDGTMRSEPFRHHGRTTVRLPFLTSCQRHFGGHLGSSRICIYATWPVSLMACRHWVQWWSHNKY